MNYENPETPEAIQADIERTRAEMSEKINTIQERLSPRNLQQQAQEIVRDAIDNSTDALTTYLRDNSRDLAVSAAETIRRNPIPAALIGLGAGWLLVEAFSGSATDGSTRSRSGDNGSRQYSSQPGSVGKYGRTWSSPTYGSGSGQYSYGRHGDAPSTLDEVKNTVAGAADQARERVAQVGEQIGQVGEQVRSQTQQWMGETTAQIRSQTEEWTDRAGEQAGHLSQQASHLSEQAYRQANMLSQQAQAQADNAMRMAYRGYDANPVVFGAVALALGAAIGMALPSTSQEDEWMGEKRDELVESAQEVVQEYGQRAQQAFAEVKPVLEQTASKVTEELKVTGQQALEEVKSSGREAVETLKQRVQEPTDAPPGQTPEKDTTSGVAATTSLSTSSELGYESDQQSTVDKGMDGAPGSGKGKRSTV